jgi:hypothetical protein
MFLFLEFIKSGDPPENIELKCEGNSCNNINTMIDLSILGASGVKSHKMRALNILIAKGKNYLLSALCLKYCFCISSMI